MIYLNITPNIGAGIGHQTYEYMSLVAFCKKKNYVFVWSPFVGKSKIFNDILKFSTLYKNQNTQNFVELQLNNFSASTFNDSLESLNNENTNYIIVGNVCRNEWIMKIISSAISKSDVMDVYDYHYEKISTYYNFNIYKKNSIAIHIRRGDIVNNVVHSGRLLDIKYFENLLDNILCVCKNVYDIFVLTQDNCEDISFFLNKFSANLIITSEIETFKYLSTCDILIASKSGFSNLCHLLGNNIVIYNNHDWNTYHRNNSIKADNMGFFDTQKFLDLENKIILKNN